MGLEALVTLFDWPNVRVSQPEAARTLGISLTTLKQICRRLGFPRWPYKRPLGWAAGRTKDKDRGHIPKKSCARSGADANTASIAPSSPPPPSSTAVLPTIAPGAALGVAQVPPFLSGCGRIGAFAEQQPLFGGLQDVQGLLSVLSRQDLGQGGAVSGAAVNSVGGGNFDMFGRDPLALQSAGGGGNGPVGIGDLDLLQLALLSSIPQPAAMKPSACLYPQPSLPISGPLSQISPNLQQTFLPSASSLLWAAAAAASSARQFQ